MLKTIPLETLIYEDELGVKTTRPSDKDVDKVRLENNAAIELSDEEPYIMPFLLSKKKWKVAPPPEDTEAENSEIEVQPRGKGSKKASPAKSSSDKVRWSQSTYIIQVVSTTLFQKQMPSATGATVSVHAQ